MMLLAPFWAGAAHIVLLGPIRLASTVISARNAFINDVQAPAAAEARAEAKAEGCWSISNSPCLGNVVMPGIGIRDGAIVVFINPM